MIIIALHLLLYSLRLPCCSRECLVLSSRSTDKRHSPVRAIRPSRATNDSPTKYGDSTTEYGDSPTEYGDSPTGLQDCPTDF